MSIKRSGRRGGSLPCAVDRRAADPYNLTMVTPDDVASDGKQVFFDAVLAPHRSLSPRGFVVMMALLAGISFISGVVFVLRGAWPVFGFFGLDVALVYIAFKANYRSGRARETLRLTDEDLTITRISAQGAEQVHRFEPHWLRVEMEEPAEHWTPLVLASHGTRLGIGAFLTMEERIALGTALRDALNARREALRYPSMPSTSPIE